MVLSSKGGKLMRFARTLIAAALCACGSAGLAQAAQAPATHAADGDRLAAALELLDGQDIESQSRDAALRLMDATLATEMAALQERGIEPPAPFVEKLRGLLAEEMNAALDEVLVTLRADAAGVYARYFTADELRELKRLQSTPVMQKANTVLPQLFAEIAQFGAKITAARGPAMQRKIADAVAEWIEQEELAAEAKT
jgi:hypothetical protein